MASRRNHQYIKNQFDGVLAFTEDETEIIAEFLGDVWADVFEESEDVDLDDDLFTARTLKENLPKLTEGWTSEVYETMFNLIYDIREQAQAKGQEYFGQDVDSEELNPFRS